MDMGVAVPVPGPGGTVRRPVWPPTPLPPAVQRPLAGVRGSSGLGVAAGRSLRLPMLARAMLMDGLSIRHMARRPAAYTGRAGQGRVNMPDG